MKIPFTKMHGLGNDFIVLDLRRRAIRDLPAVLRKLGDRRFGVGFDQALILKNSRKADFRMDIYNNDGSRVEMCGNGIRCFARYIWSRGLSKKKTLEIETLAGVIKPEKLGNLVRVDMGVARLDAGNIPVKAKASPVIDMPLEVGDRTLLITCVSMGNPHAVVFVPDADKFPVEKYGPMIENDKIFPKRTNVEFVEVVSPKKLKMRVWERGAGVTLACGTGASASAVAANLKKLASRSVVVNLLGGDLKIDVKKDGRVFMTGPAEEVFSGTAEA
jgi:diaminopimelate epimerase